jgi:hypothetical protein
MASIPTKKEILRTLAAAARTHHEFQENSLNGIRHEGWAWWYAAYILGRLGEFTTPTLLTKWLEEIDDAKNWFKAATEHISLNIDGNNGSD